MAGSAARLRRHGRAGGRLGPGMTAEAAGRGGPRAAAPGAGGGPA